MNLNTEPVPGTSRTVFEKHYCSTPIIEKHLHSNTPPHIHTNDMGATLTVGLLFHFETDS